MSAPVPLYGYKSYTGAYYCTNPKCVMPPLESQRAFDWLDHTHAERKCSVCGQTLHASLMARTGANDQGTKVKCMGELSVRAANVLFRYYTKRNEPDNLDQRPLTDLATVDMQEVLRLPNTGPKTLAEIRNAARSVGVTLLNDKRPGPVSPLDPWEIQRAEVQGETLALTLVQHRGAAMLKLQRARSEAAAFHVGLWVRLDLIVVPTPASEDPKDPAP